ncbi:M64 family metallopeptidase [Dyadobacter sp. BHUBP1]|uniref:M64 family metallopeptidase n=1 Tax=Dyadobacter sp. BHUBP1 TaxID=3424178 RepID=UPI003D32B373
MKRLFLVLGLICPVYAFSQHYQVDTLYKTGPQHNRINVVILGDGFTKDEIPEFAAEARKFADFLRECEPFVRYRGYFNFFAIETPSLESGITNPGTAVDTDPGQPVETKNTFFGVSFGSYVQRLMTITNVDVYHALLESHLPEQKLVIMLANSPYLGGSGGSTAIFTLHGMPNQTGRHEVGHTFANLADESWNNAVFGREAPNMTSQEMPGPVKWHNWLNYPPISIYQYGSGEASHWCRPTSGECSMAYLDKPFCAVCTEAIVERILGLVNPIDRFTPGNASAINLDADVTFKLDLVGPVPNSLQTEWRLNGALIADNTDHVVLKPDEVTDWSTLTATVFDSTWLSRRDDARQLRTKTISWSLRSSLPAVLKVSASKAVTCAGDTVVVTAYGCRGKVSWVNGATGNSLTVAPGQTNTYSASCEFAGSPTMRAETTVKVQPLPNAMANSGGPYTVGATVELHAAGGVKYEWTGPMLFHADTPDATFRNATLNRAGTYEVKVTDNKGCSKISYTEVQVDPILSVPADPKQWVKVSPNPAKERVVVETILPGESLFTIFDQSGRKLTSRLFKEKMEIRLEGASRLYIYKFTNGKRQVSGKIVKQ